MLHDWMFDAATDEDRAILQEMLDGVGAVGMGRKSLDKNEGDGGWGDSGIVQYYMLAADVSRLYRLCWYAETSLLKTLAAKHQSTVAKIAARYKAKIETPSGLRTCFEARIERPGKQPWSPGSAGHPSCATPTRSSPTASPAGFPTRARNSSLPANSVSVCDLENARFAWG
jgi:hypothetical protein